MDHYIGDYNCHHYSIDFSDKEGGYVIQTPYRREVIPSAFANSATFEYAKTWAKKYIDLDSGNAFSLGVESQSK